MYKIQSKLDLANGWKHASSNIWLGKAIFLGMIVYSYTTNQKKSYIYTFLTKTPEKTNKFKILQAFLSKTNR